MRAVPTGVMSGGVVVGGVVLGGVVSGRAAPDGSGRATRGWSPA